MPPQHADESTELNQMLKSVYSFGILCSLAVYFRNKISSDVRTECLRPVIMTDLAVSKLINVFLDGSPLGSNRSIQIGVIATDNILEIHFCHTPSVI